MLTIGEKIKLARKHAGMTQARLESKAGLPRTTLYLWETGKRMPNAVQVEDIAKALGITVPDLMGLSVAERAAYRSLSDEGKLQMVESRIQPRYSEGAETDAETALLEFYRALEPDEKEMVGLFLKACARKR